MGLKQICGFKEFSNEQWEGEQIGQNHKRVKADTRH